MKKNNGFSLAEILIASAILMSVATTVLPIISLLHSERQVLSDRRALSLMVHDELQQFLWTDTAPPAAYVKTIRKKEVQFTFVQENEYVKGCAEWENAKKRHEAFCLYGLPKQ